MWGTQFILPSFCILGRFIPTHVGNSRRRENSRLCRRWFIPTHVGNSQSIPGITSGMSVHPHACGELVHPVPRAVGPLGSSPRMWGTRLLSISLSFSDMVHPHACGELSRFSVPFYSHLGSSPRMWGTRCLECSCILVGWFIPTHVGNSSIFLIAPLQSVVHPHACGELICSASLLAFSMGSSPRMWGTLLITSDNAASGWFIPTHVGNSQR